MLFRSKINPEFKEAVKQMGGELLEVKEVDSPDGETDDKLADKKREIKQSRACLIVSIIKTNKVSHHATT